MSSALTIAISLAAISMSLGSIALSVASNRRGKARPRDEHVAGQIGDRLTAETAKDIRVVSSLNTDAAKARRGNRMGA